MDFVEKVKVFNQISGTDEKFNARKSALYVGLILEEVAELLESLGSPYDYDTIRNDFQSAISFLELGSNKFKSGEWDNALKNANREKFLDACVDIAVVALGGGIAIGSDIVGATHAVADNNLTKFPIVDGEYTVLRDENGKVKKPDGYKSVNLLPYLKAKE